jgi:hypothetical protein
MDDVGYVRVEESPSIQEKNHVFFTPEIREMFWRLVGAEKDSTALIGNIY